MKSISIIIVVIHSLFNNTICKQDIDPLLAKYVHEWKIDMKMSAIDYESGFSRIDKIYFKENSGKTLGYSYYGKREIWISSALRNEPALLKATLYHELAHYVFRLDHSIGIMSANKLGDNLYYKTNWNKLLPDYLLKCKDN